MYKSQMKTFAFGMCLMTGPPGTIYAVNVNTKEVYEGSCAEAPKGWVVAVIGEIRDEDLSSIMEHCYTVSIGSSEQSRIRSLVNFIALDKKNCPTTLIALAEEDIKEKSILFSSKHGTITDINGHILRKSMYEVIVERNCVVLSYTEYSFVTTIIMPLASNPDLIRKRIFMYNTGSSVRLAPTEPFIPKVVPASQQSVVVKEREEAIIDYLTQPKPTVYNLKRLLDSTKTASTRDTRSIADILSTYGYMQARGKIIRDIPVFTPIYKNSMKEIINMVDRLLESKYSDWLGPPRTPFTELFFFEHCIGGVYHAYFFLGKTNVWVHEMASTYGAAKSMGKTTFITQFNHFCRNVIQIEVIKKCIVCGGDYHNPNDCT